MITVYNQSRLPVAPLTAFVAMQGDFKQYAHTAKLAARMQAVGMKYPFFAWQATEPVTLDDTEHPAGTLCILDAHSRQRALFVLAEDDPRCVVVTPDGEQAYDQIVVPYVLIQAATLEDARKELLFLNSEYGEIDAESAFWADLQALLTPDESAWLALTELQGDDRAMIDFAADEAADAHPFDDAAPAQDQFLVTAILSAPQFTAWAAYKQRIGVKDDSKAFLNLLTQGRV